MKSPPAQSARLAIVVSHPTQYYSPWFQWLRAHTALEFQVFYLWEFGVRATRDPQFHTTFAWDVDLLSGYDHEFVPNVARPPSSMRFSGLFNPGLPARLEAWRPDAILLFGYAYATHQLLIAWARLRGVPLLFRGDSHLIGRGRPPLRTRLALRLLYAQFSALTFVGQANRDYFRTLGVPARKLVFAPHAVNATLFDPARPGLSAEAAALRTRLGLRAGTKIVLYAGKFAAAKQPRELLEAFLSLDRADAALVFVGDGEEKAALLAAASRAPAGRVHFLPFANQTEMPSRYLLAHVFALPSRGEYETWGLAINEAMHLGVPCLVSDRVGCQRDLVTDDVTGWVFRASDPDHLRDRLRAALDASPAEFRPRVADRIAGYTYAQTSAGLLRALAQVSRTAGRAIE